MTKLVLSYLSVAVIVASFSGCQSSAGTGALVGAGVGGAAGALIDRGNPWRGALIGAAVGSIVGYAIGNEIDKERERCARDAYQQRRVITREVTDVDTGDRYRVRAEPAPEPSAPTRVTTTVTKWNAATGQWEVQSEQSQSVN